jgi:hypothetical protein
MASLHGICTAAGSPPWGREGVHVACYHAPPEAVGPRLTDYLTVVVRPILPTCAGFGLQLRGSVVVRLVDYWRAGEYHTSAAGEDKGQGGEGLASLEFTAEADRDRYRYVSHRTRWRRTRVLIS